MCTLLCRTQLCRTRLCIQCRMYRFSDKFIDFLQVVAPFIYPRISAVVICTIQNQELQATKTLGHCESTTCLQYIRECWECPWDLCFDLIFLTTKINAIQGEGGKAAWPFYTDYLQCIVSRSSARWQNEHGWSFQIQLTKRFPCFGSASSPLPHPLRRWSTVHKKWDQFGWKTVSRIRIRSNS